MNLEEETAHCGTSFHDENVWTPFKKFQASEKKDEVEIKSNEIKTNCKPLQKQDSVKVVGTAFEHSEICACNECIKTRKENDSKNTNNIFTRVAPLNMCYLDNGFATADSDQLSLEGMHLLRGELFWSSLLASSFVRKHVRWRGSLERENFVKCLRLRTKPASSPSSSFYEFERFSDESEDDSSSEEELFGLNIGASSLYSGVHVTEDGLVFNSREELEEFKAKMDGMQNELNTELEMIKNQHQRLKAEKVDDKDAEVGDGEVKGNVINGNTNGNTNGNNNTEKAVKDRPKSAILVTLQGAFSSIAKVGNIGSLFSRNGVVEKVTAEGQGEGEDDEDEEPPGPVIPEDFHDEWTRKMESDGGLRYQSSDNTTKHLSYNSLPPPLKLDSYIAEKKESIIPGSPPASS